MDWLWNFEDLLRYHGTDFVGLALTFTSLLLLGKKRRVGFLIGAFANVVWLGFGFLSQSAGTVLANAIFGVMNTWAWWRWRQDEARGLGVPT
jgi:hypothetical protein